MQDALVHTISSLLSIISIENINSITSLAIKIFWHEYVVFALVGFSVFAGIMLRFPHITYAKTMVKLAFDSNTSKAGISSMQSLFMSLGGCIGAGNISGVTAAIVTGGPGAIFWMWIAALFTACSSFIEAVLAQLFKIKISETESRASIALYSEKLIVRATKSKILGSISRVTIALICMIVFAGLVASPQCNSVAVLMKNNLGISNNTSAIVIGGLFFIVTVGGLSSIVRFAEVCVPFMGVSFIVIGIVVVFYNLSALPSVLALIISSAFSPHAAFGGILGTALVVGVKRGVYSNEAGMASSGPHVSGAAATNHPAIQGFIQMLAVLIDTWLICTVTAIVLLISGVFNVYSPEGVPIILNSPEIPSGESVLLMSKAIGSTFGDTLAKTMLTLVMLLFTFTTIMNCFFIGESNAAVIVAQLKNKNNKVFNKILSLSTYFIIQAVSILSIIIGCLGVGQEGVIWDLADAGAGLLVVINIPLLALGLRDAVVVFNDFDRQIKNKIPSSQMTFNPNSLKIYDADFWNKKPI